ncbi:hypothetical protein CK203_055380 [Vitis vinifera]|uniref:Chromo domain-containing protein n=1 Tax=Vitis vinifera TaxID=29760 RepID=A0A438HMR7_VITVI|nr:hypothetical protein CK203_055380 [Vitis vinifera]
MLRACVMDFKGKLGGASTLIEFSYNNSFQSSIGMASYEALYGRPCRSPMCWMESGEASFDWARIGARDYWQDSRLREILDNEEVLRTKTIPLVKVLWDHHGVEETTWELESDMRKKYPELFTGADYSYENLKD